MAIVGKLTIFALLGLSMSCCVAGSTIANSSREARDFTQYNSPPTSYDAYDPTGSYPASAAAPDKWSQSNLLLPSLGAGCGSGGLMKPILAGILGALLLKIPLLLAAKIILLKLFVPFGLLAAAAPVLLPVAYMFFNKKPSSSSSSHNDSADARAFERFLTSSDCLEKIACSIGRSQAPSDNGKTFSWMLKSVETMLGPENEMRSLVGSYRTAYLAGANYDGGSDGCSKYQCSFPEFFVRQGGTSIKLL